MELESPSDRLQEVIMDDRDTNYDHNDVKMIGDLGNDNQIRQDDR